MGLEPNKWWGNCCEKWTGFIPKANYNFSLILSNAEMYLSWFFNFTSVHKAFFKWSPFKLKRTQTSISSLHKRALTFQLNRSTDSAPAWQYRNNSHLTSVFLSGAWTRVQFGWSSSGPQKESCSCDTTQNTNSLSWHWACNAPEGRPTIDQTGMWS